MVKKEGDDEKTTESQKDLAAKVKKEDSFAHGAEAGPAKTNEASENHKPEHFACSGRQQRTAPNRERISPENDGRHAENETGDGTNPP